MLLLNSNPGPKLQTADAAREVVLAAALVRLQGCLCNSCEHFRQLLKLQPYARTLFRLTLQEAVLVQDQKKGERTQHEF